MKNTIYERFHTKTDLEFLDLLIRADLEPIIDGVRMPGFPDLEFQKNTVGSRGASDLAHEPYNFTSIVRMYAKQVGIEINTNTRLLDFGVGWGRMIRFFFRDILSENLYGIDTWQKMIDVCNELLPSGNYSYNSPYPPTEFNENTFDLIISYSVFSHLRADAAEKWIQEFARILKPGGIVIATTEGSWFLSLIEQLKNDPKLAQEQLWYGDLLNGFSEPISVYHDMYSNGEYIYVATGGGDALDSSFYGDAVVPEKYIKDIFGKYLDFKSFSEESSLPQPIFVLQKTI